jgi:RCC1 and BTB domain-containing protein
MMDIQNFVPDFSVFLFSGNLGNEAVVVTKSDEVFAVGSNAAGCLGLGDLQSTLVPKKVEALCSKGVKGMICNIGFMVVYALGFIIVPKTKYSEM